MGANYILMNIIIPLIISCVVCVCIFNAYKIAELAIWFASFEARKAYKTAMKSTPILSREFDYDGCEMYIYKFNECDLSAIVIENYNDHIIKIGINKHDKCVYSARMEPVWVTTMYPVHSDYMKNKIKKLHEHLRND